MIKNRPVINKLKVSKSSLTFDLEGVVCLTSTLRTEDVRGSRGASGVLSMCGTAQNKGETWNTGEGSPPSFTDETQQTQHVCQIRVRKEDAHRNTEADEA